MDVDVAPDEVADEGGAAVLEQLPARLQHEGVEVGEGHQPNCNKDRVLTRFLKRYLLYLSPATGDNR
jgi:hypothetical protein